MAPEVGKNWMDWFLVWHHDKLATYWSKPLDTQRAKGLNAEAIADWFTIVKRCIIDKGIIPENIYAMDESGFPPSNQGSQRVIGHKGLKTQHKQGRASRENVTALVTICADSTVLRPCVIFKGDNLYKCWVNNNVAGASYVIPYQ